MLAEPTKDNSLFPMGMREFKMFRALIHEHTGIWLRDGKQVMLASRLSRRLRHHGLANFADYYEYVKKVPDNSDEIRQLINCVTTNKTSFFRERHHFEFLASHVVPQIQSGAQYGAPRNIRVWSAACSTGEEAYSIAMTLLEISLGSEPPGELRLLLPTSIRPSSTLPGARSIGKILWPA